MTSHAWTAQQREIFAWFKQGPKAPNLIVEALAGSAKTTTILEGVLHAPEASTLICAFNKRIQEELATKIAAAGKTPKRVIEARTLHSAGLRIVTHHWRGVQVDFKRGEQLARSAFDTRRSSPYYKGIKALIATTAKVKDIAPRTDDVAAILKIGHEHNTLLASDPRFDVQLQAEMVLWILRESKVKSEVIDFNDMVWLPLVHPEWDLPQRYQLVVVDEMQDLSTAQLELAIRLSVGRVACFEDPNQGCYSWRGAERAPREAIKKQLLATYLPLTMSFRCSVAVAAEAKRLVPEFEASATAAKGSVSTILKSELGGAVGPGDFVLSRTNAPLATTALKLLRSGIAARVEGKDVYEEAKELWEKFSDAVDIFEFRLRVARWAKLECEAAEKENSPHRQERAQDRSEMLLVLAQAAKTVKEVILLLRDVFNSDPRAVVCSTIHKAKGLERDRVFVLRDTLVQYRVAKPGAKPIHPEEYNLEYIAITRARKDLVWVLDDSTDGLDPEAPIEF